MDDSRQATTFELYRHPRNSIDSDTSAFSISSINAPSDQAYSPFFTANALSTQLSTDSATLYSMDAQQHAVKQGMGAADPLQHLLYGIPEAANINVIQLMETEMLMRQQAEQTKQSEMYLSGSPNMKQSYLPSDADLFLTTQAMVDQQIMETQLMGSPKTPAAALVAEQNMLRSLLNSSPRLKNANLSGSPTLSQQRLKASPTLAQARLMNSPSPRLVNHQVGGADRHLRRSYSAYPMDNKARPSTVREQLSCSNLNSAHARDVYAPAQPRPKKRTSDAALQRPRSHSTAALHARGLPKPISILSEPSPLGEQVSTAPPYPTANSMDYMQECSHQLKRHQSDPILANSLYTEQGHPSPQLMEAMLADISNSETMNNLGYGLDQISIASPIQVAQHLADEVFMSPELMHSTLHGISPQLINRSLAATPSTWNEPIMMNESQYNSIGLPTSMFFGMPEMQGSPQVKPKHSPSTNNRSLSMVRSMSGKSSMETMLITLSTHCKWKDCGLVFNTFQEFQEHLETVHVGSRKATYECYWHGCSRGGKSFNKRVKIISHLRTHTGERPYVCDHPSCLKSFKRHDALENHKKTHTGKPEYRCTIPGCRKEYYHEKSLKKHCKKEHPEGALMACDDDEDDEEDFEEEED